MMGAHYFCDSQQAEWVKSANPLELSDNNKHSIQTKIGIYVFE